jgi:hypothetical protein
MYLFRVSKSILMASSIHQVALQFTCEGTVYAESDRVRWPARVSRSILHLSQVFKE